VQNSTKIYGEYCSDGYDATEDFIFSFANDDDIRNMKVCHMNYNNMRRNVELNLGNTFRMNGQNIEVRNSGYDGNNVINSNVMIVPMEIEVFLVSN